MTWEETTEIDMAFLNKNISKVFHKNGNKHIIQNQGNQPRCTMYMQYLLIYDNSKLGIRDKPIVGEYIF